MEKRSMLSDDTRGRLPEHLSELKTLVQQLEWFLPEDKRNVIHNSIEQIENNEIQSEAQARELLNVLMQTLGIEMLQK